QRIATHSKFFFILEEYLTTPSDSRMSPSQYAISSTNASLASGVESSNHGPKNFLFRVIHSGQFFPNILNTVCPPFLTLMVNGTFTSVNNFCNRSIFLCFLN